MHDGAGVARQARSSSTRQARRHGLRGACVAHDPLHAASSARHTRAQRFATAGPPGAVTESDKIAIAVHPSRRDMHGA